MKTVEVIVEHAGKNLSAYIEGAPVITVGNDMKEIEDNMKEAIELYLEDNPNPCEVLSGEFELKFKIDAATFINYYSSIFTKAALSRITGINERQLWHYAAGVHKPRRRQLEKIQKGIQSLSRKLSAAVSVSVISAVIASAMRFLASSFVSLLSMAVFWVRKSSKSTMTGEALRGAFLSLPMQ